ncbi:LysR family transcriptional regulator [Vibrio gallaecicus]|uniref:LysR family transcriptional regulator n=1 Tax=Vibrio gallaecicus TaxID=552386 RepID=A0ABV4NE07_9VIBR
MLESKHLRHFLAVAQSCNFTAAAKTLHIAQPALSISIKKLEQTLDTTLFRRGDKQVSLTEEGKVLFDHAKRISQQFEDAQLAMNELKGLEKGEVRLGAPSMMGSYFFPQIVMAFKSQYPNLKLSIIDAGTESIREMLLNGELDIGVINNDNVPDDLEIDHLLSSEMLAVVGKEHPFASLSELSFEEFFSQDLVMFKPGYFHRDFIDSVCEKTGLDMTIAFETNLLAMILSIVKQEFAVTALLSLVTEYEKDVVGVPFSTPVKLNLALAWRKEGYLSRADKTFIEFVKRYV